MDETKEDPRENVQGIWRVILEDGDTTYLIRTDSTNAADSVHTDIHSHTSRGYGGAEFRYRTVDGSLYTAKGPWLSSPARLYNLTDGEFNASELHFTRVKLTDDDDNVLYEENQDVLGPFWRGYRAAQQLAVIQDRRIHYHITSDGGGSVGVCRPDREAEHPLSRRKDDK
jgi:hypothetical protein